MNRIKRQLHTLENVIYTQKRMHQKYLENFILKGAMIPVTLGNHLTVYMNEDWPPLSQMKKVSTGLGFS